MSHEGLVLGGMNDETAHEQLKRAERRLAEIRDTLQKRVAEKGALMTARVEKTHHPGTIGGARATSSPTAAAGDARAGVGARTLGEAQRLKAARTADVAPGASSTSSCACASAYAEEWI